MPLHDGWLASLDSGRATCGSMFSDCMSPGKYRRLPFRKAIGAGIIRAARRETAAAQQPATPPAASAAPALPPGSPLIGRPAGSEAAAKLAPVAPPPIAAAP